MNLNNFLSVFFPDENEPIHLRAFKPKGAPEGQNNTPKNWNYTRQELFGEKNVLLELKKSNHLRGIYFVVNAGGHTDRTITRFNAVFVEDDKLSIADQHRLLNRCPLLPSIRVETKRSIHAYWLLQENCSEAEWRDLQKRIIAYFGWDEANTNPARLMRVPDFLHLTYNENATGNYDCKWVKVVEFHPERRYSLKELQSVFPSVSPKHQKSTNDLKTDAEINNGSRNKTLFSIAGSLRHQGLNGDEIFAELAEVNKNRVNPPLSETEVASITKSVMRYEPGTNVFANSTNGIHKEKQAEKNVEQSLAIPELSSKALHGLAGEIVQTIEPHTEADNAALLTQLLAGFGCLIGKTAHFRTEADFHYTKLFVVLVGASSKGRKGTSWGQIRRLLIRVDESFANCIQDGLSSGEGLIHHVRDPLTKKVPVKERNRIVDYQDEIVDEGAREKRAFVVEPEFALVLRAMARDGNTLSSIIRQAWDSDRLSILTKNPTKASETHISIIGHIIDLLRN